MSIVGMSLGEVVGQDAQVAGSDGVPGQTLMDTMGAMGMNVSVHEGNAAPEADNGIAGLVSTNKPANKGYSR